MEVHSRGITGSDAEKALDRAGITVNKNSIPFDPLPPMKAGGIRLGSPSVTTRGMKEPEMESIAKWVAEILLHVGDAAVEQRVRKEVAELAARSPSIESRLRGAAVRARRLARRIYIVRTGPVRLGTIDARPFPRGFRRLAFFSFLLLESRKLLVIHLKH